MIDTMNNYIKNGFSLQEAAARGAVDRFRPIISTTLTTIIGLIPLALGSPAWMPLCAAIIFGLLAATLISLIIIPCLFYILTSNPEST
jgi:multidrug efflux pump subunit AcrB